MGNPKSKGRKAPGGSDNPSARRETAREDPVATEPVWGSVNVREVEEILLLACTYGTLEVRLTVSPPSVEPSLERHEAYLSRSHGREIALPDPGLGQADLLDSIAEERLVPSLVARGSRIERFLLAELKRLFSVPRTNVTVGRDGETPPSSPTQESSVSRETRRSVLELASDVLEYPGQWLRTPNAQLGHRKPIDLIETDEEIKIHNLLNAVDQGSF